jgi:hypothetical protein
LKDFFDLSIEQIVNAVQINRDDMTFISYWIKNSYVLLNYLKRDAGLMTIVDFQCTLNELIQSLCAICTQDMEKKMFPIIEDGLLDFSSVDSVDVKYEGLIDGMARSTTGFLNWSKSTIQDGMGKRGSHPDASPKTGLEILSTNLDALTRFQSILLYLTIQFLLHSLVKSLIKRSIFSMHLYLIALCPLACIAHALKELRFA